MMEKRESLVEIKKNALLTTETKNYYHKWVILILYILYSGANSFQWMEYSIINNIVMKYYNVSSVAVDWTSISYMLFYPIIVVPVSYVIDLKGLRVAGLFGCVGTAVAAFIKLLSIEQDRFYMVLIGQSFGSAAQVFILCLPSKIAAVWFEPNEISTICSLALIGTQFGFALGFVAPVLLVENHENIDDIGSNLSSLCWLLAGFMVPVTIGVFFYFQKQPSNAIQTLDDLNFNDFFKVFIKLLKQRSFALHALAYGLHIGVISAIGTFLNQFILFYFPDSEADAGRMGLFMIISGIFGSIFFGFLLDKTRKYKEITFIVYLATTLSIVAVIGALRFQLKLLAYITFSLFGFLSNAYMLCGIEFGVELTFPADESTSTGILIALTQFFGVVFTLMLGQLSSVLNPFHSLITQVIIMIFGTIITACLPNVLKRQAAFKSTIEETEILRTS